MTLPTAGSMWTTGCVSRADLSTLGRSLVHRPDERRDAHSATFAKMNRVKPYIRWALPYLRNKYVVTGLMFVVWVGFIDDNNIISQVKGRMKLAEVYREREFYLKETRQSSEELKLLQNDKELLERFARERYLMKRPDEDIFVFTVED